MKEAKLGDRARLTDGEIREVESWYGGERLFDLRELMEVPDPVDNRGGSNKAIDEDGVREIWSRWQDGETINAIATKVKGATSNRVSKIIACHERHQVDLPPDLHALRVYEQKKDHIKRWFTHGGGFEAWFREASRVFNLLDKNANPFNPQTNASSICFIEPGSRVVDATRSRNQHRHVRAFCHPDQPALEECREIDPERSSVYLNQDRRPENRDL